MKQINKPQITQQQSKSKQKATTEISGIIMV